MIDRDSPVTEDELHAYVDGELPADRAGGGRPPGWPRIPSRPRMVAAWRAQAEAIRARYGAVANEPVPERLTLDRLLRQGRASGRRWAAMAAAAARRRVPGRRRRRLDRARRDARPRRAASTRFTADALEAYRLYVVEVRHPVEVPGSRARRT